MTTMNTANAAMAANQEGAVGRCQLCGNMRQTALVQFHRNIGMLVLRQTRTIQGSLCKTCVGKTFWKFEGLNLLLGPWGVISLIMTPIYLITNIVAYVGASKKLSGAVE
jgi:hypothetical protein